MLFERLNAIEAELDPAPFQRGRLWADAITLILLTPFGFLLEWELNNRPLVLLLLLLSAVGLNRLVPFLLRTRLRRERDRLVEEIDARRIGPTNGQPNDAS